MPFAEKIEKKLHQVFQDSRFTLTRKIWLGKWLQSHIKIGISKDSDKRLKQINRNIFNTGHTEWFAMNYLELLVLYGWVTWEFLKWFLVLFLFILFL